MWALCVKMVWNRISWWMKIRKNKNRGTRGRFLRIWISRERNVRTRLCLARQILARKATFVIPSRSTSPYTPRSYGHWRFPRKYNLFGIRDVYSTYFFKAPFFVFFCFFFFSVYVIFFNRGIFHVPTRFSAIISTRPRIIEYRAFESTTRSKSIKFSKTKKYE